MPRYRIITLVDITRTQISNNSLDTKKKYQQSNFNTLLQTIGLRANISWQKDPIYNKGALPTPFKGKAAYWTWEFDVEQESLFEKHGDPVALLKDDLDNVPVVSRLDETVNLDPATFKIKQNFNTLIEVIS